MATLTVEKLFEERKTEFELALLNSEAGLKREVLNAELHRPGLALAGFYERFPRKRTQLIGETELAYFAGKDDETIRAISRRMFSEKVPLVIVAKGLTPPESFLA